MDTWIAKEIGGCTLPDQRLGRRLGRLLGDLAQGISHTLPRACEDWAATKAAYRFLDNPRVDESAILAGHFEATRTRFAESTGLALVLHDTTEFSYRRTRFEPVGQTRKVALGQQADGRPRWHTLCGLLMHSSLVVTREGPPLGLAAAKFGTRKKFKGTNALRNKVNATRVPIEKKESYRWIENIKSATAQLGEPERCVHIADREGDIFELFCEAEQVGTYFLIRTCVDRLAETGKTTIAAQMRQKANRGNHHVQVRNKDGQFEEAKLRIAYRRMTILPPIGKQKKYPSLPLTVIHAQEKTKPKNRDRINWKLMTNLPIDNLEDAADKLDWYAMRWKIETYHKVLKSGCRAEDAKLRTAERLINLIAVYCILAWRVFWLCMLHRTAPQTSATVVFTKTEQKLLDRLAPNAGGPNRQSVSQYLQALAQLGGYLARNGDPPPGNMVIWRGMARLTDIHLGYMIGAKVVGN